MKHVFAAVLATAFVGTLAPVVALASAPSCTQLFTEPKILNEKADALAKWKQLKRSSTLRGVISDRVVIDILNDKDLPVFGERLEQVFTKMLETRGARNKQGLFDFARELLTKEGIPSALIEVGERDFRGDRASLMRLLGNLTFKETRWMYVGYEEGAGYTSDSLLGRYISESGAAVKLMPLKNVLDNTPFSEKRLVVAVSEASFPAFQKYFSGKTMMTVFGHANVYHAGSAYSHAGAKGPLRALGQNTPLPILILKPSEGERMYRYMELAVSQKYYSWNHALKHPWKLPGYTQKGAYECCTHWIGNVPIGDKLVESYRFPERREYAYAGYNVQPAAKVEIQKLQPWQDANHPDLKQVWKAPGNEQLSSVIGQLDTNIAGEFASPGYVIQSLFGPTSNERVPILFLFTPDHTVEIPDAPALRFEGPA